MRWLPNPEEEKMTPELKRLETAHSLSPIPTVMYPKQSHLASVFLKKVGSIKTSGLRATVMPGQPPCWVHRNALVHGGPTLA
jgi:hypothetical protein